MLDVAEVTEPVEQQEPTPNLISHEQVIGWTPITLAIDLFEGDVAFDLDHLVFYRYLVLTGRHPEWS